MIAFQLTTPDLKQVRRTRLAQCAVSLRERAPHCICNIGARHYQSAHRRAVDRAAETPTQAKKRTVRRAVVSSCVGDTAVVFKTSPCTDVGTVLHTVAFVFSCLYVSNGAP